MTNIKLVFQREMKRERKGHEMIDGIDADGTGAIMLFICFDGIGAMMLFTCFLLSRNCKA